MPRPRDYQQDFGAAQSDFMEDIKTPIENRIQILHPIRGINLRDRRSQMDMRESPNCKNARISRGYIEPRPGIKEIATGFDNTILYIREAVASTGEVYAIIITMKSLYYSTDLSTFTRAPFYYSTGTISSISSTAVTGSGTSFLTECHAGDKFKLDADADWVTIASITDATHLTLSAAYSGGSSGAYKIDRYFSGAGYNIFWGITLTDSSNADRFYFCQGIDPVMYIALASMSNGVYIIDRVEAPAANYGMAYEDRLIIGDISNYPYRVKWTIIGSYHTTGSWTGTGSGYKDLVEDPYEISGFSILSGSAIIYKYYSIIAMTRTGISDNPFDFKTRIPGVGCYIPGTLNSVGDQDIFVGSDNIYLFDGRNITAAGEDKIREYIIDAINPNYSETAHALVVEEFAEYQLYYPDQGSEYPNKCIVYNYDLDSWISQWDIYAHASGYCTQQTGETWASFTTETWNTITGTWGSVQRESLYPLNMIAQSTALYAIHPDNLNDNGSDWTFEWETKDIAVNPLSLQTLHRAAVAYTAESSTALICGVSVDGGETWTQEKIQSLRITRPNKTEYAYYDFLITGEFHSIRLRVISGGKFKLIGIGLDIAESGIFIPSVTAVDVGPYYAPSPPSPPAPPSEPSTSIEPTTEDAPPYITAISPLYGTVGSVVTITGRYFGDTQGTSYVQFAGVTASISSWADRTITCTVPTGASSGSVSVTTSYGTGYSSYFSIWTGFTEIVDYSYLQSFIWEFCEGSVATEIWASMGAGIGSTSYLYKAIIGGVAGLAGSFPYPQAYTIFKGNSCLICAVSDPVASTTYIYRSTDYLTWTLVGGPYSNLTAVGGAYLGNNYMVITCAKNASLTYPYVLRSTNNGVLWNSNSLTEVYGESYITKPANVGSGLGFVGTYPSGKILRTTDYFNTFTVAYDTDSDEILTIEYMGQDNFSQYILLAGSYTPTGGRLYRSISHTTTTLGDVWTDVTPSNLFSGPGYVWTICNLGDGKMLFGTGSTSPDYGGFIYVSTDYGLTWSKMSATPLDLFILSIKKFGSYVYAGTYPNAKIYRMTV